MRARIGASRITAASVVGVEGSCRSGGAERTVPRLRCAQWQTVRPPRRPGEPASPSGWVLPPALHAKPPRRVPGVRAELSSEDFTVDRGPFAHMRAQRLSVACFTPEGSVFYTPSAAMGEQYPGAVRVVSTALGCAGSPGELGGDDQRGRAGVGAGVVGDGDLAVAGAGAGMRGWRERAAGHDRRAATTAA